MADATCSVDGCGRLVKKLGWCGAHEMRWRRTGSLNPEVPIRDVNSNPPAVCSFAGCEKKHFARGWCNMHYNRVRAHGDPSIVLVMKRLPVCSIEGCNNKHHARGWCRNHFYLNRNTGDPLGKRGGRSKREASAMRHKTKDGYVLVFAPDHPSAKANNYVHEHRLVMESKLGRYLMSRESVHHLNGVRDDNRPENLELWVRPQPAGQRPEDLVAWVVENYPEYVEAAMNGCSQLRLAI